ncbi:MAG: response regulator [Candidatus Omnitrophica bacterium]|nr:response regulator [Candidatus Omnitrophota bacterium]
MRRMLIVEDERDIADCLQQFFQAHGFTVASAFSGEEALTRLEEGEAEVILLDILLPGLSGIEILKRAKALYPRARVIMVTALDRDELRVQAHRYGACGYITKPFDFSKETWAAVFHPSV